MAEPLPTTIPGNPEAPNFGVTVDDVKKLVRQAQPSPYPNDPQFGPDAPEIADDSISLWITVTAKSVAARLNVLAHYKTNTGRWGAALGSAQTATLYGAAATYAAVCFPSMAATNDQSNFVGLLRSWYEYELALLLEDLPKAWAEEDKAGLLDPETGGVGVAPIGSRALSSIPEHLFYSPNNTGWDYRAPGSERPLA